MDISVVGELFLVLYSLAFGICVGILYDCFRVSRLVFHLNGIVVFIEDILFCLMVAASYFIFCFLFNHGQVRLYVTVTAILGWFVYYITIGKAVYFLIRKCMRAIGKLANRIKNRKKPVPTK